VQEVRDLRKEILPFTGNTKFKADQVVDLLNSVSEQVRSKLNNIKAEALKIQSDTTKWYALPSHVRCSRSAVQVGPAKARGSG
jgi:hypothetical protein